LHGATAPHQNGLVVGSTHVPSQSTWPPPQVGLQVPLAQTFPFAHTLPALPLPLTPQPVVAPQNAPLLVGSMQVGVPLTLHRMRPAPQVAWQVPPEHTVPLVQSVPAVPASPTPHPSVAPQNWLLLSGFTHPAVVPQPISPVGQVVLHDPATQLWLCGHTAPAEPPSLPQPVVAPQNWVLVVGSMQLPLQMTWPVWHVV
jgi:hypothetical protein